MKNNEIAIIGCGYVGAAMVRFFADHHDVVIYDPALAISQQNDLVRLHNNEIIFSADDLVKFKRSVNVVKRSYALSRDVIVVCVPTPANDDGSCDVSSVERIVHSVSSKDALIIIKSTVTIGTTHRLARETHLRVVFSPEYCGESSYSTPYKFHTDVKETPFFTFGGDRADCSACIDLYMPIVGPTKRYNISTASEAEMAKYMENVFFAMKITFCYEMKHVCDALGIDYNVVRELWLNDPRINPMHTSVFSDNVKCFSGKCLPKDLKAIISTAVTAGYEPKLLMEIDASNERIGSLRNKHHVTKVHPGLNAHERDNS